MAIPKHLKKVANAWDSGRVFNVGTGKAGRKMTDKEKKSVAKMTGATKYKSSSGKIVKVRRSK